MKPLVSYLRVSTAKQGRSGLWIEAQREVLTRFAEAEGFIVVEEFIESRPARVPVPSNTARAWRQPSPLPVAPSVPSRSQSWIACRVMWPLSLVSWPRRCPSLSRT
jgi:hypothetical protein